MRKKTAKIYSTISRHVNGRQFILENKIFLNILKQKINDSDASVRYFNALTIQNITLDLYTANSLVDLSAFVNIIVQRFTDENSEILIILLSSLEHLLLLRINESQNESDGTMEALVGLFNRLNDNMNIVGHILACLVSLCQNTSGIVKAIEMNLLTTFKSLLYDTNDMICGEMTTLMAFMTLLNDGKYRAIEFIDKLVELAGNSANQKCRIMSIKTLTNIAEVPDSREILLEFHSMFIEDIDTCCDDFIEYHKKKLLDVIRWSP
ncbi:uncharacterized protein LOC122852275 [Aphidius gifuensis]|uniref:uncharacterized protein LOC122852275 n=1 Tax=Aphidius gifuensis TaxID=684658 RepID=UPI001CDC46A2|nr:uncharacterized protein LOC122852275 [Aphidius gifuensis]